MVEIEDLKIGLLKTARELGVAIVAYSPLGRGPNYVRPFPFFLCILPNSY